MSETLATLTANSSAFVVRESLRALRQYNGDPDPASIDRVLKTAEILSTSLKKLARNLEPAATKTPVPNRDPASLNIDITAVNTALKAVLGGQICPVCGGVNGP